MVPVMVFGMYARRAHSDASRDALSGRDPGYRPAMQAVVALLVVLAGPGPKDEATLRSLHPEVQKRIIDLRAKMKARRRRVVLTSGARQGDPADSLHNQSLATDVKISGLHSVRVARELEAVGFSCAIPYFDSRGRPCRMAHADLRHTPVAEGPYAPDSGTKHCPAAAISKTGGCNNDSKGQWSYFGEWPRRLRRWKPAERKPAPASLAAVPASPGR
jgi:hypothetical protein